MIMILSKQWLKKYISSKSNTNINEWSRVYRNWSRKLNTESMMVPIIFQIVLNVDQIWIFTKKAEIVQRTLNDYYVGKVTLYLLECWISEAL